MYDGTGKKLKKVNSTTSTTTDYVDGIQYTNGTIDFIQTEEGGALNSGGTYSYQYDLKDHLGNVRFSFGENPVTHLLDTLQRDDYYAFGLRKVAVAGTNDYLYNGKELQDELGQYDYGARFYDPVIARWNVVDPLAESRDWLSPYNYVQNNPVIRVDPNGMLDDYKLRRDGEIELVAKTNDKTDRILKTDSKDNVKTNRKGEAKVAIDGIEKGILKEGQNFQNKDQVISVGGNGQPSVDGVKSFTLQLSEHVGKEIKGYSYSANGSGNATDVVLGKYVNNDYTKSTGSAAGLMSKYGINYSNNNILQEFHTHPEGKLGTTQSDPGLSQDVTSLQGQKPLIPNATFIILYRILGQRQPGEYDYTHEYRTPKK